MNDLKLKQAIFIIISFTTMTMIIPHFQQFESLMYFPQQISPFPLYLIILFLLTIYSIKMFGAEIYKNVLYKHNINMETLIFIGSASSLLMAIFEVFTQDFLKKEKLIELAHFLETSSLILVIIYIGKFKETSLKKRIREISNQIFQYNQLISNTQLEYLQENKNVKKMEISYLQKGQIFLVEGPFQLLNDVVIKEIIENDKIPLIVQDQVQNGNILSFQAFKGQQIKAGAQFLQGKCKVEIINEVEKSILYQITSQIDQVQNTKDENLNSFQIIFSKIAQRFVLFIIFLALLTFIFWTFTQICLQKVYKYDCFLCFPIERFISVLVISCPCSLGLAIPCIVSTCLKIGIKNLILFKKNNIFSHINEVKNVIFDKTGTLFTKFSTFHTFQNLKQDKYDDEFLWEIINTIEYKNEHKIAQVLLNMYSTKMKQKQQKNYEIEVEKIQTLKNGIQANIRTDFFNNEQTFEVLFGNSFLISQNKILIPDEIMKIISSQQQKGNTVILMTLNKEFVGYISLNNSLNLRPEAKQVVKELHKMKKNVYILSGDSQYTVQNIGRKLNIQKEFLHGDQTPQQKQQFVKSLKQKSMMIGDGLNDILSLEEASIGVCINSSSELNLKASDIILLGEDLRKIPFIFQIVGKAQIFIFINLFWAFSYNLVMIPIAIGCFCQFQISPLFSSLAMCLSSILVMCSGLVFERVCRWKDIQEKEQITNNSINNETQNDICQQEDRIVISDDGSQYQKQFMSKLI